MRTVIGWNPARFAALMIPAILEKFGSVALFILAFLKTPDLHPLR